MPVTLQSMMEKLPEERRRRIRVRANELIAEEMTLRALRKAEGLTQTGMAELLDTGQDSISRLENRGDMRLSTLQGYVAALGGVLEVVARFPGRPAVVISAPGGKPKKRAVSAAAASAGADAGADAGSGA